MEFEERMLYGGGISLHIPQSFDDISAVRDVPDHQEVFVDKYSDCSIIVELLDEACDCESKNIAEYYFNDISEYNNSKLSKVITSLPLIDSSSDFSFSKCYGTQLLEKKCSDNSLEELHLYILVIRLLSKKTDIVISFNNPRSIDGISEKTTEHYRQTEVEEILDMMLKTIRIIDYNLFV